MDKKSVTVSTRGLIGCCLMSGEEYFTYIHNEFLSFQTNM